jgi:hypothetical protein
VRRAVEAELERGHCGHGAVVAATPRGDVAKVPQVGGHNVMKIRHKNLSTRN